MEGGLTQVQDRRVQGKEKNFSTNDGVALHKSMWNMQQLERNGSKEKVSYILVTAKRDPETYEEVETSQGEDRWVQDIPEELQSLQKI